MQDAPKPGSEDLNREAAMGGKESTINREMPRIDCSDYLERKVEIADALWSAATEVVFFQLINHGIAQTLIDETFAMSERFFALPASVKARYLLKANSGGNTRNRRNFPPVRRTKGNPTRSPRPECATGGRRAASWPASGSRCWLSKVPIGRSA